MLDRILGVFKLDRQTFKDIEADTGALNQAVIVVAIVAGLSVVGQLFSGLVNMFRDVEGAGFSILGVVMAVVMAFVNWFIWSAVTWLIGTKLFNGEADLPEMLRLIGFAQAPQMLKIIPCIGGLVGAIWSLIAGYFAIKEGLDLDDGKTIATVLIGWLVMIIIGVILGMVGIGTGLGLGALTSALQG